MMSADLPYAGTSGWSGTDTSQERALQQDASGVTAQRQAKTLALVEAEGERGLTVVDLRTLTGWHHGQASGMLSVLHKVGRIDRLTERRGRCHVYVHPTHRQGRETQPHGRRDMVSIPRDEHERLLRAEEWANEKWSEGVR